MKIINKTLMLVFVLLLCSVFSKAQVVSKAYGNNMKQVDSVLVGVDTYEPVFAVMSGDINQDGSIDIYDIPLLITDFEGEALGYLDTDLNGDGAVDIYDIPVLITNFEAGVYIQRPF